MLTEERSGRSLANTFPFQQQSQSHQFHSVQQQQQQQQFSTPIYSASSDQAPLLVQNPLRARGASIGQQQQHFQQHQQQVGIIVSTLFSFLRSFYRNVFFNDSCSASILLVDYIKDGQIFDLIKYEINDVTYSSYNTGVPARGTVRAETAAKFPRPAILPGASTATTFSANTICLSACLSTTTRSSSFYSITHSDI
jgi:hypothetical protein